MHKSKIRISLGNRDRFTLSFRRDGKEIAALETIQDRSSWEIVPLEFEVPAEAVQAGYNSIRVLPSFGEDPYRMGSMELAD